MSLLCLSVVVRGPLFRRAVSMLDQWGQTILKGSSTGQQQAEEMFDEYWRA